MNHRDIQSFMIVNPRLENYPSFIINSCENAVINLNILMEVFFIELATAMFMT